MNPAMKKLINKATAISRKALAYAVTGTVPTIIESYIPFPNVANVVTKTEEKGEKG